MSALTTIGLVAVLGLLFAVAAVTSPGSNQGIPAASALVLISAAALGIERVLEVFWTFIDSTGGSFWPITSLDRAVNNLANSISEGVGAPLKNLDDAVEQLKNAGKLTGDVAKQVPDEINSIRSGIAQLQLLAPTSDRAKVIADYTTRGLNAVAKRYPVVESDIGIAVESISVISSFVESLDENPGRRILSIYVGVLIGLGVVMALGLDVFQATLVAVPSPILFGHSLYLGVAATGLLIGLGANPTHEVIKLLQSVKQQQQKA
jgi:hypothetical protein